MKFALLVLGFAVLGGLAVWSRQPATARTTAPAPTPGAITRLALAGIKPTRPTKTTARARGNDRRAEEIADLLKNGTAADRDVVFDRLLPALVAADAPAAARLACDWNAGPVRLELIRGVAQLWADTDVGAAVRWLASLDDRPEDQQVAVRAARTELGRTDPASAVELSQYFGVGYDDGSLEHLVQLWTEESPGDAVEWITGRPAGPERDLLLARVAWVRAQRNPAEAVALVTGYMLPGATRDAALADVARQWARRDPATARAWAGQLTDGPARTRSLAAIAASARSR